MPEPKHRGPLLGELLGAGALIAIATGAITFATQWGGVLAQVTNHIDPPKHAAIVLAGNIETERKITAIEVNVTAIKDDLGEARTEQKAQAREVQDVKSNQQLILHQLQQIHEESIRARRAAERHNGPD